MLVIKVFEGSPADGILQENDVILKIDDYDIADDGTIQISQDVLTDYKHAIDMHHSHDQIELTFARDGNLIQTSLRAMQSQKTSASSAARSSMQYPSTSSTVHRIRATEHELDQTLGQDGAEQHCQSA